MILLVFDFFFCVLLFYVVFECICLSRSRSRVATVISF